MQAPPPANENGISGVGIGIPVPAQPSGIAEPRSRFRLWTVEEIEKLPPARWFIQDILPENGLAVLYGAKGSCKTFLALDWALCASSGVPWHDHAVTKGHVIYVYAEATQGIRQRIQAWRHVRKGAPDQFRAVLTSLDVCNRKDAEKLIAEIRKAALDPVLVVIDTLARCFGDGDENATQDMNKFVRGCETIKNAFPECTMLVVHHTGKDGTKNERGSSALGAAADAMLRVSRKAKNTTVVLDCEKQKDGEEFKPIKLKPRLVAPPNEVPSCVLERSTEAGDADPGDPRVVENDQQALNALATFGTAGTRHNAWRDASGLKKTTFRDTRKRLEKAGLVLRDGKLYRIAPAGSGSEQGQNQAA